MQFIDLAKQQRLIKDKIDQRIQDVLAHGKYIMGPEIREMEAQLADYVGVKHCVSCASGTDALLMPLLAWGIGPGDAVFTTPFTFIATAEVIQLLGATPVFVDIDRTSYNIDPTLLDEAIETVIAEGKLKPKAIIPVDLFGLPADYPAIEAIAQKYDIKLLEDAAQGFGGQIGDKLACSFGDAASTSFFPAKPLGCYGDGGAIFTDDDDLYEKLVSIRVHGKGGDKYDNVRIGLNGRMDTLQAAIVLEKFQLFPNEVTLRNKVAKSYNEKLAGVVVTPSVPDGYLSSWAQYSILAKDAEDRQTIQSKLKAADIPSAIYYPKSLHQQTAFAHLGLGAGDFPVSEEMSQRIFSLPMYPYLEEQDIKTITEVLKS
ncbi:MAG: DegT/DnrJ/EryC1/StrS family aminotransferase [Candidatus Marinimicrobia bacterium]|nr:DegT/DnrJ/EryC1/StrS family aminotransferase [Candidatus Neomarinimicrobiota bacterium]MCF7850436.1 DegT/DnrJ/EryC1/StrS family aminotransferase [Candidatus Neomarinimicrobiota bacterium]MCF7904568.1 DegT/DnrJ/EryC1/StrS family aminotransferase [Candidatus Neomarinimicrobiota bacterium]